MGALVFSIKPENQSISIPCKTLLKGLDALAGYDMLVSSSGLSYHSFLEFVHILFIGNNHEKDKCGKHCNRLAK